MSTKNKPWLNAQGKKYSDDQLKVISKNWSSTTWDEYLKTIEVAERRDTTYVTEDYFEAISSDDVASVVFNLTSGNDYPHLKAALYSCVMSLPETQKAIVKLYYWEGLSITEIALKRSTSKPGVSKSLKRAIQSLHKKMINGEFKKRVQISQNLTAS